MEKKKTSLYDVTRIYKDAKQ